MDDVERIARLVWDHRRAKAAERGIELEEWGDGTIPKANFVLEEARLAIEAMKPKASPEFDWLANLLFGPAGPIPPYPR